jgi:nicotinate-nucleotide adenylyltransferase
VSVRRTGIFGGTFDPIHVGHLYVAEGVRDACALDRILFAPMAAPAHRETHAPPADRRAMTELAIAGNTRFALDTTGLEQSAPAYTADTLPVMREKYPSDAFFFIAGIDSLTRSRWRDLDRVARALEQFIVVGRERIHEQELDPILEGLPAELQARFRRLDLPLVDVSSTAIRQLVKDGRSIRYLVPDAVLDYIAKNGLYK